MTRRWTVDERSRNIHRIRIVLPHVGDEQWVLLQSDLHWDNPKCDRETLKEHLELARERDAPIVDIGDFFCAMQGKWDKRANKNDLRPEHQRANYLDALIDTSVEWWKPYADLLTVRGEGNHETSILKKHETRLIERFVERMRSAGSQSIHLGGYSGFVVFEVVVNETTCHPIKLYYHHGYGGGGPVTRGVIGTNRRAVYLADADIVHTGHTHDAWILPIARIRLNQQCSDVMHCRQVHVCTPGYKEEYGDGYGGWHVERGGPPKPVGAAWLRVRYEGKRGEGRRARALTDWDLFEAR